MGLSLLETKSGVEDSSILNVPMNGPGIVKVKVSTEPLTIELGPVISALLARTSKFTVLVGKYIGSFGDPVPKRSAEKVRVIYPVSVGVKMIFCICKVWSLMAGQLLELTDTVFGLRMPEPELTAAV